MGSQRAHLYYVLTSQLIFPWRLDLFSFEQNIIMLFVTCATVRSPKCNTGCTSYKWSVDKNKRINMTWTHKILNTLYYSISFGKKTNISGCLVQKIFIWEFGCFKIQYIRAQKVEKNKTDVKGWHHNCTKRLNHPWPGNNNKSVHVTRPDLPE